MADDDEDRGEQCYRALIWHNDVDQLVARLRKLADRIEATKGTEAEKLFDKPGWLESHEPNWGGDGGP